MNDTPRFSADQVDELLSAELDGAFDAAARDLGFDPAEARDRLAAQVPGLGARRAALGAARDALAELPVVDELVVARVRAKAVKAAAAEHEVGQTRIHQLRRFTAIAGGLAAAIAVIAGLAFVVQHDDGSAGKNATSAPAEHPSALTPTAQGATTPGGGGAVDLGAVADVPTLVARASAQAAQRTEGASAAAMKRSAGFDAANGATAAAACEPTAEQISGVGTPTWRGLATLSGTQVQVYVFRKGAADNVVVLSAECRLVASQTLPTPSG
jgi:hypothetical protein